MRVSVVTTVYNGQSDVAACTKSVLDQQFDDFEWLVVDDGSTDGTLASLHEATRGDPRVRIIASRRLGRCGAFNFAVQQARGGLIAPQDIDDISYPERLASQAAFLDDHPRYAGVGAYYVLDDRRRGERYVRQWPTAHQELVRLFAVCVPVCFSVSMFRRDVWQTAGGFADGYHDGLEDFRAWLVLLRAGWQLGTVPEVLGEHRVHDGSYWFANQSYMGRQLRLAQLQSRAIHQLGLSPHLHAFALARILYPMLPKALKRLGRRHFAGSREADCR